MHHSTEKCFINTHLQALLHTKQTFITNIVSIQAKYCDATSCNFQWTQEAPCAISPETTICKV